MISEAPKKVNDSSNGRWKKSEHDKFMKALEKYGRDWVKVQKMVKSRSLAQVRSHAQKTFLKMSDVDIQALIAPSDYDQSSSQIEKYVPVKRRCKQFAQDPKKRRIQKLCLINDKNIEESSDIPVQEPLQIKKQIEGNPEEMDQSNLSVLLPENSEQQFENKQRPSIFMQLFLENIQHFLMGGNFMSLFLPFQESH